ncbi:putative ribonuclease YokI [Lentibacillus populi]|uniref:Ribonuclease YokI n=1 Tax=Lentibacillus populi TaxID=1827502 RepID=A0A9W5TYR1_9BACI|nr:T7SS effector LXG polymorphic toxin [Lentibacillus populi]GGB48336.1 putative ribonuclease YokI [Lentibacillus populi]
MKTLDSASLHEGINATLKEISHVQAKITEMQKGVRGIIDLENYLRGRTGESIRSFYEGIHAPFLIFLYQSLTHYRQTLEKLQQAVQSYEPNEQGLVREEFLEVDVQNGLDKAERVAADLVDEANGIMASVSDLVSLPKLDMEEFSSMVQKGKKKVKNNIEQLYNLDYEQTKSLTKVGEDLTLLNQYINEMSRTFASDYSITTFNALTALKLPSLPTILKEVYGEPVIEEKEETSLWTKIVDGAVELGKGIVNTSKGAAIGVYDVGKDTLVGIGNTIIHPVETVDSTATMVIHPVETGKYIGNAIAESFERDMINGDAESRSHWVTYALGTVATAVFGTKGAGTVTKTGVATTKTGAKKAAAAVENIDLSRFLPYAPQYQLAGGSRVPYNVVDGVNLRDELIRKAENFSEVESTGKNIKKANPEKVVNDLSTFQSKKMTFGNQQFLLDKKGMKHILERHHLEYWNGTIKKSQSFLDKNLSVDDVANIVESIMQQNRTTLMNHGTTSSYQIFGTVNGIEYVVGLNKGRIGQLYSK